MESNCMQVGLWQEAQEVMQRLQGDGVQPNTIAFNALIKALGSGGQWEAVRRHQTSSASSFGVDAAD